MGTPFYQSLDPAAAPSPVTPADSPGDAAGWAEVTPDTTEPAPYSISAPQSIDAITAAVSAAGALSGAGIVYPAGPRQGEAEALLTSPQGQGAMNVLAGFPDYESADISPGANMAGSADMDYPGTTQDGLRKYGTS